jgi:photosystem II stability/assembly factor-like uncharacterized protein
MKKILYTVVITTISLSLSAQLKINTPLPVAPENNAINQMPDVTLDWNAVCGTGQVSYKLQIDKNDTFTNPLEYDINVTSASAENLLFGEKYYWRVRAYDQTGESEWSETFSFNVLNRLITNYISGGDDNLNPEVIMKWKRKINGNYLSGFTYVDCQTDTTYYWKVDNGIPVTEDLNGIYFVDSENGFAVGDEGKMIQYDGNTWEEVEIPIYSNLNDIYMFDVDNGLAAGRYGKIIKAENGTWTIQNNTLTDKELLEITALDENHIWIVGKSGTIIFIDANGMVLQNSQTGSNLYSVCAIDTNDVWAVGNSGKILHFDGSVWSQVNSPTSNTLYGISFVSPSNGWIIGKNGPILHYDGSEWTEFENPESFHLNSIKMINENLGIAVGNFGELAVFDGISWTSNITGAHKNLYSITVVDEQNIWLAGKDGTIVFYNTNNPFGSPASITKTATINQNYVQMSQLYFGSKYFWRVRARHNTDTSEWSMAKSFTTVEKVTPVSPSNNANDLNLDLTLQWEKIDGSFSYIYELSDDPDFTSSYPTFTDQPNAQIQGLMYGKSYYWRVKAAHSLDTTIWSDVWHFTTINTVYLTSPADEDTVGVMPALEWEGQNGTDGYIVQYDISDNFNEPEISIVLEPNTSFQVVFPLENNQIYYWRVKAFNTGDTTNWSEVRCFFVNNNLDIEDILTEQRIKVFPNPVSKELTVIINTPYKLDASISLSGIGGRTVYSGFYSFNENSPSKTIDVSSLNNGIYFLHLSIDGTVYSKKIVIDK